MPSCRTSCHRSELGERDVVQELREALDNSQSLLVAMLVETRPANEIEDQINENRAILDDTAQRT